jgi:hypothetical protein
MSAFAYVSGAAKGALLTMTMSANTNESPELAALARAITERWGPKAITANMVDSVRAMADRLLADMRARGEAESIEQLTVIYDPWTNIVRLTSTDAAARHRHTDIKLL